MEFWQEEAAEDQREMRRMALRWGILFLVLFGGIFFALWWAGSTVHFSSSRVQVTTGPSYRVTGVVRDAGSGAAVPWADVRDDPGGRPPFFEATANRFGEFELKTIAEPHSLVVSALGYRVSRVKVGRTWYAWMPEGDEVVAVRLVRE